MFSIAIIISLFYFIFSAFLNVNWLSDITCYLGYPLAIYIVLFIALIPGFVYMFTLISLLIHKKEKKPCIKKEKDVTILIPVYNAKNTIQETLESIKQQDYCGKIYTIIIDDGSTDGSLELLNSLELGVNVKVLKSCHKGKSFALNKGLKFVRTKYVITVDSDTILHPLAVKNIMAKLISSNYKTAATAGCLFVKNDQKSFITKLQQWDYTLGIFGVKLYQGFYHSTLVAQGAFSAYKTKYLKQIGGWQQCVGEDIVLTWELLSRGYEVNFAKNAIGFTEVPETFKKLGRQRTRWARGMIEAFKKVNVITSIKLNLKSKFLMCCNLLFPFVDLALLIFVPLGIFFLLLGNQLLIGWLTLLVIPLGLLLCWVIEVRRKNMLKEIKCELETRSTLAFIFYVLLYAFVLAPYCLIGYLSELFNVEKKW